MIREIILTAGLCLGLSAGAQALGFSIDLPQAAADAKMRMAIAPANDQSREGNVELNKTGASLFTGTVAENPGGIYDLYVFTDQVQMSLPVYVSGEKEARFSVTTDNSLLRTSLADDANLALYACNKDFIDLSRSLLSGEKEFTDQQLKEQLKGYVAIADSVTASYKALPPVVKEYIGVWAYISAFGAFDTAAYLAQRKEKPLPFSITECMPDPASVMNSNVAAWFPQAGYIVASSVKGSTITERMDNLYKDYTQPEIREMATPLLIDSFLRRFNYARDFDEGEAELESVTAKYNLPDSYLATFRARRSVMPGAPFPQELVLVDKEGTVVDFTSFRGKYVYIDLWASWCRPCIAEVPKLKILEKMLEDGNVTFVSISLDTDRQAWLDRMEQLNLKGNQLLDRDGRLGKLLNISGIPHFLIYDPEGNLYKYNAPRPSSEDALPLLESL